MTSKAPAGRPVEAGKQSITIERIYKAAIEDVWALWTTKDGIESWWGPGGFSVSVRKLDVRPGGDLALLY